jgi:hypothetical protein
MHKAGLSIKVEVNFDKLITSTSQSVLAKVEANT